MTTPSSTRHIIHALHLEVEAPPGSSADAGYWQDEAVRLVNEQLLPQLERLFEQWDQPEFHVRLDRLELMLSVDRADDWRESVEYRLPDLLSRELNAALPAPNVYPNAVGASNVYPNAPTALVQPRTVQTLQAFEHFLETGALPWFFSKRSPGEFEADVMEALKKEKPEHVTGLLKKIISSPSARRRLAQQFSQALWSVVALKLTGEDFFAKAPAMVAEISSKSLDFQEEKIRRHLFENALAELATGNSDPAVLFATSPSPLAGQDEGPLPALTDIVAEVAFFADDAGLALIASYFPSFLKNVGLIGETGLLDGHRAAHLFHYIATGDEAAPEYDLPFCKILAGLPVGAPLDAAEPLTELEKTETDDLLRSVIRHWDVLRNTSTEGLRQTFLMRQGKLSRRSAGDGWLLQLEKSPFDVLLNYLPWACSVIRLPWMTEPVFVE
ncbi:MAG: contractile injection system tape measure protein [Saprospiraceae bacterium]